MLGKCGSFWESIMRARCLDSSARGSAGKPGGLGHSDELSCARTPFPPEYRQRRESVASPQHQPSLAGWVHKDRSADEQSQMAKQLI